MRLCFNYCAHYVHLFRNKTFTQFVTDMLGKEIAYQMSNYCDQLGHVSNDPQTNFSRLF